MRVRLILIAVIILILHGCFVGNHIHSARYYSSTSMYHKYYSWSGGKNSIEAGTLTAGEVNDFEKWERWNDLSEGDLNIYKSTWRFHLAERYSVQVTNLLGEPLSNKLVILRDHHEVTIWSALTDNAGRAELWNGAIQHLQNVKSIRVWENGKALTIPSPTIFEKGINIISIDEPCEPSKKVDILFAVDATGSMGDEIEYLKTEIIDIMQGTQMLDTSLDIHLGSLFYRCLDNSYVTRKWDFTSDFNQVKNFINKQAAAEGGLEAVEVALKQAITDMSWRDDAHAKLLFLVLDEPPGNTDKILEQLHADIQLASSKGIRIIPLIASGTGHSANKSLEYLMRCFALATNGTTAFLTGHSGIGGTHTAPTTDSYDVEKMNKLILRIINRYTSSYECGTDLTKFISQIKDTTSVEIIEHVVIEKNSDAKAKHINHTTDSVLHRKDHTSDEDVIDEDSAEEVKSELINKVIGTFKFYPNPTNGVIHIQCWDSIGTVYLSDANGKLLDRFPTNNMSPFQIDISNNPPGLYLIQCQWKEKWFSGRVLLIK